MICLNPHRIVFGVPEKQLPIKDAPELGKVVRIRFRPRCEARVYLRTKTGFEVRPMSVEGDFWIINPRIILGKNVRRQPLPDQSANVKSPSAAQS